jgi:hypothetical protein
MKSKAKEQLLSVKRDRNLFHTLFITCQVCDIDLERFFQHENQVYPPSLSDSGNMRLGSKSDILQCLENLISQTYDIQNTQPNVNMLVNDGAAMVHMIKPGVADTFNEYASKLVEYVQGKFRGDVCRVDIVFDSYRADSLKAATWRKRGSGVRICVQGCKTSPGNWPQFLREDRNKTQTVCTAE